MTLSIRWDTSRTWAPVVFIGSQDLSKRTGRTSRAPMATTEQGSSPQQAYSICWRRCTRMKRREVAKHDVFDVRYLRRVSSHRTDRRQTYPPASLGDFRSGDFRGVRISGAPQSQGACEVHPLDAFAFSAGGRRHRLGHVPLLALNISL